MKIGIAVLALVSSLSASAWAESSGNIREILAGRAVPNISCLYDEQCLPTEHCVNRECVRRPAPPSNAICSTYAGCPQAVDGSAGSAENR